MLAPTRRPPVSLRQRLTALTLAAALSVGSGSAQARETIHLMPSMAEILRLDGTAETVIVANPAHVIVQVANPETLILIPQAVGSTSLTVLGKEGDIIYDGAVVVSGIAPGNVTIRRGCGINGANANGCLPTQHLQCAGGICEPTIATPGETPSSGALPGSGNGQQGQGGDATGLAGIPPNVSIPLEALLGYSPGATPPQAPTAPSSALDLTGE